MAYEEMSEPWLVLRLGDWVTDKRGNVWRIVDADQSGFLCLRRSDSGRKTKKYIQVKDLTKIDDAVSKILTSVNKESK